jgi:hypothetical protein
LARAPAHAKIRSQVAFVTADTWPMTRADRLYVLVLGLAAAAGWMSGLVLLPVAAWALMEVGLSAAHRVSGAVRA